MNKLALTALLMIACALTGCGEDVIRGNDVSATVLDKHQKSQWTQIHTSMMWSGKTMIPITRTTIHPEQNKLLIRVCDSSQWVDVSRDKHDATAIGDTVIAIPKMGEDSGKVYGWWLED